MRAALLALGACAAPVPIAPIAPIADPVDSIAPGIVVPIEAETEYAALDPQDPRLGRACDELAYMVAHGGAVSTDLATSVLRMHGIVDPPEAVLAGAVGDSFESRFGEERFRPNAMIGTGSFEHTAVAILIFVPNIRIAPVPRATETGIDLAVTLDPALRDPRVTVADSNELFHPVGVRDEQVFRVTVPCGETPGERYVTIEATDPRVAATPLVIFPIYCKLKPPSSLEAEPPSNLTGFTSLENRVTAILNRERIAAGRTPLHRDARVERAALTYATDRAEDRRTDRTVLMRRAGLLAPAMAWTTFHVDSLESGIDRILNSAEERAKLEDPDRTDVGVGARRVVDGWWISIIYITIPPPIDTAKAAARLAHSIRVYQESVRDIKTHIDLYGNIIATRYANALAVGWSAEDVHDRMYAAMVMRNGVGCEVAVDRRVELASLDLAKLVNKHEFHNVGVGIAQSAANGALAGTIWIVVLFY